jgi:uncharacterized glyoxalase superfamily protein PhnB
MNLAAVEIKAFVPSQDFERSKQFYLALGFEIPWTDDWHAHIRASGVESRFGVAVGEPENRPWAMRDFTLVDPSGVLWRIAQNIPRDAGA